eukprot:g12777.t1
MTGHGRRRPPASPRHHVGGAPSTPSTPPPAPRRRAGDDLHGRQREDVVGAGGGHYATVSTATDTVKRTAGAAGARSRGAGTGASSRRKRRPACDMGFTHLGRDSVRAATELVAACRDGERTLPAGIISRYHPSSSCICRRPDCFYEFFRAATKDGERRNCHSCPAAGRAEKRWYKVPPGDGGGTGKWQCHACYKRELAERDETGGTSSNGPAVILLDPPLQHPMKKVREEVEGSVAAGNVVYWEDVYLRLAEERKAVFGQETSSKYGRDIVRKMFYAISEAGGSKARVVSEEGDTIGVDGRERILCLLPNDLRDDLILKIVVETREAAKKEGKSALERALKRAEDNPEDVDARMAVVTSAGAIVRQDVQADKSLQNAPARGEKHRYAQELAMPLKPVLQALAGYPSTLVGMLQSVTLMGLQGDVVGGDPKATQPAWVWDETWASDALTDAEEEDPDFGGDDRVSPSPPAAESVSDEAAARIEKENVKRRSRGRVLLMQFVSLVKGVLGEEVGTFDDASKLKRRSELTYDDIVEGPDVREGEQRDEAFWRKLGLAAVDSATSSLEGTEAFTFTCVECKLREIVKPQPRASTKVDYLFIQRGGTKAFHDNKAAAGADGSAGWRGCRGRTLLDAAAVGGNPDVLTALLRAGAQPDVNVVSLSPKRQLMNDLLMGGADPNSDFGPHGSTPLHQAAASGQAEVISALILRGANKDALCHNKTTPLMWAAEDGRQAAVETLLAAGADLSIRSATSDAALDYAAIQGHVPVIVAILRHGADVDSRDVLGLSALHKAGIENQAGAVDVLAGAGADIDLKTTYGDTPLMRAAFYSRCKLALLKRGAAVKVHGGSGETALHRACVGNCPGVDVAVDLLLRWGADETAMDDDNETPGGSTKVPSHFEYLKSSTEECERARVMLSRAPADRAWRRRSWLVVLRSRASTSRIDGHDGVGNGPVTDHVAAEASSDGGRDGETSKAAKTKGEGLSDAERGVRGKVCSSSGGRVAVEESERRDLTCLVARLLGLELEGVFRTIVGYI